MGSARSESEIVLPLPLASESQQPYVTELLSFTLDRLHKEPELLRVDADRIRRQMQEVAVGNYRSFIAAADALIAIRQEVSSIDNHLESLVLHLLNFFYILIFNSTFKVADLVIVLCSYLGAFRWVGIRLDWVQMSVESVFYMLTTK